MRAHSRPALRRLRSAESRTPGPPAGAGPASPVLRQFHPPLLRPGLATAPVITRGQDATAGPALTPWGGAWSGGGLGSVLTPGCLLCEASQASRTVNIYPAPTKCRASHPAVAVQVWLCVLSPPLGAHLPQATCPARRLPDSSPPLPPTGRSLPTDKLQGCASLGCAHLGGHLGVGCPRAPGGVTPSLLLCPTESKLHGDSELLARCHVASAWRSLNA